MNKERLEEMEELLNDYYDNIDDPFASAVNAMAIVDKVGYFVKRMQELEQELHLYQVTKLSMDSIEKYTEDLKKQNKRYREAYSYLKSAIEFDRYVCHEKCQDVVSVKELEEGLLLFDELEDEE